MNRKIIYYSTTCGKNYDKAVLQNIMLSSYGIEYYFVYGQGEQRKLDPQITVDCAEDYSQLPLKSFELIKHFCTTSAEWLVKVDDDTFFDPKRFTEKIWNYDYIGFVNQTKKRGAPRFWNNFRFTEYNNLDYLNRHNFCDWDYVTGGFYIMSRKAAELIVARTNREFYSNTPETYIGEDKKIGLAVSKIPEIKTLDIGVPNELDLELCENYMAIHPVKQIVIPKLIGKTDREIQDILQRYNFLNDYFKINEHLAQNH